MIPMASRVTVCIIEPWEAIGTVPRRKMVEVVEEEEQEVVVVLGRADPTHEDAHIREEARAGGRGGAEGGWLPQGNAQRR